VADVSKLSIVNNSSMQPTCETGQPGSAILLEAPPAKKAKTRIVPTLVQAGVVAPKVATAAANAPVVVAYAAASTLPVSSSSASSSLKRPAEDATQMVGDAVNRLNLNSSRINNNKDDSISIRSENPKKKKRIQPVLISIN
jgi:hypothetical protein